MDKFSRWIKAFRQDLRIDDFTACEGYLSIHALEKMAAMRRSASEASQAAPAKIPRAIGGGVVGDLMQSLPSSLRAQFRRVFDTVALAALKGPGETHPVADPSPVVSIDRVFSNAPGRLESNGALDAESTPERVRAAR